MRNAWISRVGMVMLVGGLCLVGSGLEITPSAAAPPVKDDALAGVTQNWDKNLPSDSRFTVLSAFGGAAVRDNNTGLVWEQAPDPTPPHSDGPGRPNIVSTRPLGARWAGGCRR
jgi:hypothetical protein